MMYPNTKLTPDFVLLINAKLSNKLAKLYRLIIDNLSIMTPGNLK